LTVFFGGRGAIYYETRLVQWILEKLNDYNSLMLQ